MTEFGIGLISDLILIQNISIDFSDNCAIIPDDLPLQALILSMFTGAIWITANFTRVTTMNKIIECVPNFIEGNNTATTDPEKGGNCQEVKNKNGTL